MFNTKQAHNRIWQGRLKCKDQWISPRTKAAFASATLVDKVYEQTSISFSIINQLAQNRLSVLTLDQLYTSIDTLQIRGPH